MGSANARVTSLRAEITKLRLNIVNCGESAECDDATVRKNIANCEKAIDGYRKDIDRHIAQGRQDLVEHSQNQIDGFEKDIARYKKEYMTDCEQAVVRLENEVRSSEEEIARNEKELSRYQLDIRHKPYVQDETLKSPLTVSELVRRFGQPDSIIKHDTSHHTWIFHFPDGQVHFSVYSHGDMNNPDTQVFLLTEQVEVL
ncbi:MAG: hypothetical protein K8T91_14270 [Planctomycetes bacterium]|nr:hypothetical protein [Planctomycetota bacterium]